MRGWTLFVELYRQDENPSSPSAGTISHCTGLGPATELGALPDPSGHEFVRGSPRLSNTSRPPLGEGEVGVAGFVGVLSSVRRAPGPWEVGARGLVSSSSVGGTGGVGVSSPVRFLRRVQHRNDRACWHGGIIL